MATSVLLEIVEQVKTLPDNLQYQVLAYIRTLRSKTQDGTPGTLLLQFAGSIPIEDVEVIRQAIETGCEQIDWNEW